MVDSEFIERLDSLWFFSSVLSLRSQSMDSDTDDKSSPNHHSPKPEPNKSLSPIAQNQTENPEFPVQLQRYPDCGEFAAETETQMEKRELLEVLPPLKYQKRRRSKRSFKSCLNQRRMAVWVSDLQLDMGFSVNWGVEEASSGYEWFGSPNHVKMPPLTLTDGIAMKQNLKSWAYAVACTVR